MKKLTALILALCMLCALLPLTAVAETEKPKITIMLGESVLTPFDKDSMCYQLLQEKTGVEIEWQIIDSAEATTKANTMLATNSMPDILCTADFKKVTEYAPTGMFVNLQEYLDALFKTPTEQD